MATMCGTLKCENAYICEKVATCEKMSTLNVKMDAICEKVTLSVSRAVSGYIVQIVIKA